MATSNRLCAYCVQVPFEVKILRDIALHRRRVTWELGTAGRIRGSDCPLCRIVSFVLYDLARTWPHRNISLTPSNEEICLSWDSFSRLGRGCFTVTKAPEQQIFFVGNSEMDYLKDQAFCLTPNFGQALDLGRVKRWLFECIFNHGGDCTIITDNVNSSQIRENYAGLDLLRFIDVQRECIVETRVVYRYVALSYVWGFTNKLRLTTSNMAGLMKPNALKENLLMLPQTIQDAITFVRGIGEQYLWCDALCLLQNNPNDIQQGVNAMDLIYEKALLTIVAACGHNADFGLPGVNDGTRSMPRYPEEIVPGVQLDVYLSLDQAMKTSVYSSRAWTFQEEMLSRRIVYFVDNKVYFRCRSTTLYEYFHPWLDSCKEPYRSSITSLPWAVHMLNPIDDFMIMLAYYSERALTYKQDAPKAMAGIIRRLSDKMKCRFLEGLPTAAFDMFVLFQRSQSNLRRREGFPSYSWTGWEGSLTIHRTGTNEYLEQNTWIVWHERSTNGTTILVWDPLANESFPYHDLNYIGYRERRPFQCPATLSFSTSRTRPTDGIAVASIARSYSMLQFWTLSVHFGIQFTNIIEGKACILDRFGNTCGFLYPDGLEETAFFDSAGPFEMIALSRIPDAWVKFMYDTVEGMVTEPNLESTNAFYHILVLEWSEGVAERRGIGFIRQDCVTNSLPPGPVWKEILLA